LVWPLLAQIELLVADLDGSKMGTHAGEGLPIVMAMPFGRKPHNYGFPLILFMPDDNIISSPHERGVPGHPKFIAWVFGVIHGY